LKASRLIGARVQVAFHAQALQQADFFLTRDERKLQIAAAVGTDHVAEVSLDIRRMRELGVLVDVDVHGTSTFTARATWNELGIPEEDTRRKRLKRGTKDLISKVYIGRLRSLEARFRQSLDQHSFDVAGYRPQGRGDQALRLFSKDTVTPMLQNRFYLGEVQYKGQWFEGVHEPILEEELFERAQEVRRRRAANWVKARKRSRVYPLTGVAHCARCGWPMRGSFATGRQAQVLAKIHRQARSAQDVERLKRLFVLGDLDEQAYATDRNRLQAQLVSLTPPAMPNLERAAALLQDFGAIWDAAEPKERKQIAHTLLEAVYLDSGEEGPVVAIRPRTEFGPLFDLTDGARGSTCWGRKIEGLLVFSSVWYNNR
jgi:hypothetical protein